MTEAFIIWKIIFAFLWGLLMGINYKTREHAQEDMDNFIKIQNLRDENRRLKDAVQNLQKSLNENGII